MLHRLVKTIGAYVNSVIERKKVELDCQNFSVELTVTSGGQFDQISVTNQIKVENGLPTEYSETVRDARGQTLSFTPGSSKNRRKDKHYAEDKLVAEYPVLKAAGRGYINGLIAEEVIEASKTIPASDLEIIMQRVEDAVRSPETTTLKDLGAILSKPTFSDPLRASLGLIDGKIVEASIQAPVNRANPGDFDIDKYNEEQEASARLKQLLAENAPVHPGEAWNTAAKHFEAVDELHAATEPEDKVVKVKRTRAKKAKDEKPVA